MKLKISFLSLLCFFFLLQSCGGDDDDPCDSITATYNGDVKAIIDSSCSYSGCHDGGGSSIAPGNFTNYSGLSAVLNNGKFENRVITQKDSPAFGMPPDMSVFPASMKDNLTASELEIIQCWIDAGYPEG